MNERVQKVLSQWGVASRRHAEQMILEGRVVVNQSVAHLGQKVDPEKDQIYVDGVVVNPSKKSERIYLLMNKPVGVISTCDDPQKRRTVLDLLPKELQEGKGIHPVGRLDSDSTGALLLTNDGNLTFYLTHPRHHISKTYEVWVSGYPSEDTLTRWRQGVMLDNRLTMPADITVLKHHRNHKTLLKVILQEGRNRQIRRVAEQLGHPVLSLHRTAIGPIRLRAENKTELPIGSYRPLANFEICFLNSQFDLTSKGESVINEECNV